MGRVGRVDPEVSGKTFSASGTFILTLPTLPIPFPPSATFLLFF